MTKKDYYDILGLKKDCKPQEVKKMYYNLALQWHPDKHHHKEDATSKFSEIREAYSVLIDPAQRRLYDKFGHKEYKQITENQGFGQNKNIFFTKGFQGTNKSAFDVLWDILKDEPEEFSKHSPFAQGNNMAKKNTFSNVFENPSSPKPNFSNLLNEQFSSNGHYSFNIFDEFKSHSENENLLGPFSIFERSVSSNWGSKSKENNINQKNSPNFNNFEKRTSFNQTAHPPSRDSSRDIPAFNTYKRKPSVILIEDDENIPCEINNDPQTQFIQSFSAQLEEFQFYLNDFDKKLDNWMLSPTSKKITKIKKTTPSLETLKTQNKNFHNMPIHYIPQTFIPS